MQIQIRDISHSYDVLSQKPVRDPKSINYVLKNINWLIPEKTLIALVGNSGSGKTTLLQIASKILQPTAGEILWMDSGEDNKTTKNATITPKKNKQTMQNPPVMMVFQFPEEMFFCASVYEELAFGLKILNINENEIQERIKLTLDRIGIKNKEILSYNPLELSTSQARLIALAIALISEPKVLLLDEPFAGLDAVQTLRLLEILVELKNQSLAIVLALHHLELVNVDFDQIFMLEEGKKLYSGAASELLIKNIPDSIKPDRCFLKRIDDYFE